VAGRRGPPLPHDPFYTFPMHPRFLVLALLLATAAAAHAQQPQQPRTVDVTTLGPKLGETAPDFSAPDQHGTTRKLSTLLGPKGALLVFYRSADW
jgi:cytochrome oxidase Cu insertion factor (SCO1/SenC/PrrC family)